MSPLFGKKEDGPSTVVAGGTTQGAQQGKSPYSIAAIDTEFARLGALSLPQLAAEVMTKAFSPQYQPGDDLIGIGSIFEVYCPPTRDPKYYDVTTESQLRLQDLLAEGVQLLEQARLVRLDGAQSQGIFSMGYVTTRLGRTALESNTVDRALAGGSP